MGREVEEKRKKREGKGIKRKTGEGKTREGKRKAWAGVL